MIKYLSVTIIIGFLALISLFVWNHTTNCSIDKRLITDIERIFSKQLKYLKDCAKNSTKSQNMSYLDGPDEFKKYTKLFSSKTIIGAGLFFSERPFCYAFKSTGIPHEQTTIRFARLSQIPRISQPVIKDYKQDLLNGKTINVIEYRGLIKNILGKKIEYYLVLDQNEL